MTSVIRRASPSPSHLDAYPLARTQQPQAARVERRRVERQRRAVVEQHAAGTGRRVVVGGSRLHAQQRTRHQPRRVRADPAAQGRSQVVDGVHVLPGASHVREDEFGRSRSAVPFARALTEGGGEVGPRAGGQQRGALARGVGQERPPVRRRRCEDPRQFRGPQRRQVGVQRRHGRVRKARAHRRRPVRHRGVQACAGGVRNPAGAQCCQFCRSQPVVGDDGPRRPLRGTPAPPPRCPGRRRAPVPGAAPRPCRRPACSWPAPAASTARPGAIRGPQHRSRHVPSVPFLRPPQQRMAGGVTVCTTAPARAVPDW